VILALLGLVTAALFAGAALYISAVELTRANFAPKNDVKV